jgi:hypothetical protein
MAIVVEVSKHILEFFCWFSALIFLFYKVLAFFQFTRYRYYVPWLNYFVREEISSATDNLYRDGILEWRL